MPKTYREMRKALFEAFDEVDNSTLDQPMAVEDIEHLQEIINH